MKIIHIVGARPNFMKIAPLMEAIAAHNSSSTQPIHQLLVHTGQHYDARMSKLFFDELDIPKPDINLEVGSASHSMQTAQVMERFEKVCLSETPTHILVVGDVNSTLACALVGAKMNIRIIHVEAGLRSFNRLMPEEINRVLTDAISDYLFITEKTAVDNLLREGISKEKIFFVGNVMIDTLMKHKERAQQSQILDQLNLRVKSSIPTSPEVEGFGLLTLHRPSNVDDTKTFKEIIEALAEISKRILIIFPVHPRTRAKLEEIGFGNVLTRMPVGKTPRTGIIATEPLGYLDFLCLMSNAKLVLTDSGGIQEETTVLGIPCVTLRNETERPVTTTEGTNIIAGTKKESILKTTLSVLDQCNKPGASDKNHVPRMPYLWDGHAAKRIVEVLSLSV